MRKIIITHLSPGELFRQARKRAIGAQREIERLRVAPLAPGETLQDRTLAVATLAHELSDAFGIMEALIDVFSGADDDDTDAQCAHEDSVSPPVEEGPPLAHRGVQQEDDPSTN